MVPGLRQIATETDMVFAIIRPPLVYGPGVKANFAALMRAVQRLCGNLQVDISKAHSLLGWVPPISSDEGCGGRWVKRPGPVLNS